ncbi:hypothetical protein P8C59_000335 [Phyllachora maydis]|uniref:Uncharacterized protein n=1 Tax=Phyllachora maydis TaxID=1825666 RepID=A0AAD9M7G0_9PEZI|nr:hypothetical protein P8C59_000335 [Phyllachora maydis]
MDDATRLVQDLQDKLAELDTEVSAYQRDLLARFRRYMDARLQHVPDDVAHQVVRAIAESMASFPSLNPLPPPHEDRPEVELVEDVFEYEAEDEGSTVPEKTKYLPTEGLELDPPMDLPAQPAASTSQPRPVPPPRSAVSAPAMETATGSANMVGRSVGSYKGRSFNIPSIKDPRLYDEIANMENVHFFVGSIDGKSGAEAANMNSYRAMTSGAPSSTPRSFAERLMSEDIIELRENGWINDGSHGVGARADADDALPDVAEESESESDDGGLIDTTSNTGPMDGFGPSRRAALLRRQRKESRALRALMRSHYQALEEDDEPISPAAAEDAESTRREA